MNKPKFVLMSYVAPLRKYFSVYSCALWRFAAYILTKNHNIKGSSYFQWDDDLKENKLGVKTKERVA